MLVRVAALLATCSLAEKTWLRTYPAFPSSKTLEVVGFLTIKDDEATEISIQGPVTLKPGAELKPGLQISVIQHSILAPLQSESASFCCDAEMVKAGKCQEEGDLYLPGAYSFSVNAETMKNGFGGKMFKPGKGGFYYVTLSNCGNSSPKDVIFTSGELSTVGKYGFLPGEEAPKMQFYMYLAAGYAFLLVLWGVWCHNWTDVLFKIHHYITIGIIAGLFEAACWYVSLYHWNYMGHRWWSVMLLACGATVTKQGVCYLVMLFACLGMGVTKPKLEKKTIVQATLLTLCFIVSDGSRLLALMLQNRITGVAEMWKLVLLVTPGSLAVSVFYVWILQAMQDTINELTEKRQTVKLEVYQNLRMAVGIIIGLVIGCIGFETFHVRRQELALNWESRYVFTDVLSHCCFFVLLAVVMFLWRPNERSVQMAFSEQVGAGDVQMAETGKEEDFQNVDVELGE